MGGGERTGKGHHSQAGEDLVGVAGGVAVPQVGPAHVGHHAERDRQLVVGVPGAARVDTVAQGVAPGVHVAEAAQGGAPDAVQDRLLGRNPA